MLKDKRIPIVKMFPDIINRKAFLNQNHPSYSPVLDKDKYISYWDEEYRRCVEGWWVKEKDYHWRYMNPDLYHYINHWTIKDTREESNAEVPIKPRLRDTEWIIFTGWTVCAGFSGFTEDHEYSSNNLLKKYYQEKNKETDRFGRPITLSAVEKRRLEKSKWVKRENGEYKMYINPIDALKTHYSEPKGLPLYENPTQSFMLLGSRGTGKSFSVSSIIGKEFTFNGRKYYKTSLFEHGDETGSVFAGAETSDKIDSLYDKVFYGLDRYSGAYEDVDKEYPPPFFKFRKGVMEKGSSGMVEHKYEVQYTGGGNWVSKGSASQMYKGIYRNNPDAAVGERKNIIVTEEVGLLEDVLVVHANNENVISRNGRKIGRNAYIGTGGNIYKIAGAKKLFNAPTENGILAYTNDWDRGQEIGLFIPVEYTLEDFKDENGNTMLEEAREFQLKKRFELAQGRDTTAFTRNRMFEPICPDDMFLSNDNIIFDQGRASARLSELESVDDWMEKATFGELKRFSNKPGDVVPIFTSFTEGGPIVSREIDESAGKSGCIVFHRHPPKGLQFRMKGSRFRITYDPVKVENDGPSLASILVLDTKYYDIAAEYIGRRDSPDEIHDMVLDLALYYNCPVLYEKNVDAFVGHAKRRGLSYMLYPTPLNAISQTTKNPNIRYGEVGVSMTGQIKKGAILQAQALMNKLDEDGRTLYNKIQSTRLLEEMEVWDGKMNSDHISSFLIQALWEEEEAEIVKGTEEDRQKQYEQFKQILLNRKHVDIQRAILNV